MGDAQFYILHIRGSITLGTEVYFAAELPEGAHMTLLSP